MKHLRTTMALGSLMAALVPVAVSSPAWAGSVPTCAGEKATIVGTSGTDTLTGTGGHDVIVGLKGRDTIRGNGGRDVVCGNGGSDRLIGGAGDDRLFGGQDTQGDDRGGPFLLGDTLNGGTGNDHLDPGYQKPAAGVTSFGDTITYTGAGRGVRVDVAAGTATGEGSDRIVTGPHLVVEGSAHSDTLRGAAGRDSLWGMGGADHVIGAGGADELSGDGWDLPADRDRVEGGAGNDRIESHRGADTLLGGGGKDTIETWGDGVRHIDAGPGADGVSMDYGAKAQWLAGSVVRGGSGRDRIDATSGSYPNVPRGTFTIDVPAGELRHSSGKAGVLAGFEGFYSYSEESHLVFVGSPAAEHLEALTAAGVDARMAGGNDSVHGSFEKDRVDSGAGHDEVSGDTGDDTCPRTEERHSCHP